MSEPFNELGDAINDQRYVDVDLALRRGQHIDREDADWYAYLLDAQAVLEPLYRRYGCELVHRSDGYFFLLPTGDKVGKRLLGLPEMVVGQGAALLYLDPRAIESGGVTTKDDLLSHLAAVMGTDTLVSVFNPKRKRMDERVAQETVRQRVAEGLRKLAQLGFVAVSDDGRIHLRSALMRFADPVRGAGSPRDALEKLIARGEVSIPGEPADDDAPEPGLDTELDGAPADEPSEEPNELDPEYGESASDLDSALDDDDSPFDAQENSRSRAPRGSDDGDIDLGRDSFATDFEEPMPPSSTDRPSPVTAPSPESKPARKKRKRESIHPETTPEPVSRRDKLSSEPGADDAFDAGDFEPEGRAIPASALEPAFDEFD